MVVVRGVASPELMVQLRVVLRGVSPLIWRRLAIGVDATLADLHEVLQVPFGWSNEHLHRFRIHGGEFGIFRDGGVWFDEDARRVRWIGSNYGRVSGLSTSTTLAHGGFMTFASNRSGHP